PDHVDAHRSLALAISPFSRRRVVDSTMYTTSGLLRTMELILGLPPMSQYDGAATPMYNAFQATPVLAPFVHLPPRVSIDELNEIIWRSVKGPTAVMPPAVRSAFVRRPTGGDGDDDDRR